MRRSDLLKTLTALTAISVLGGGFAVAAIRTAPPEVVINPLVRTLSAAPGIRLTPTFAANDEDCLTATRTSRGADGLGHSKSEIICRQ